MYPKKYTLNVVCCLNLPIWSADTNFRKKIMYFQLFYSSYKCSRSGPRDTSKVLIFLHAFIIFGQIKYNDITKILCLNWSFLICM